LIIHGKAQKPTWEISNTPMLIDISIDNEMNIDDE
jgi:hypothetical protein